MPKRSRKEPGDYAVNAFRVVAEATGMEIPRKPPKAKKPAAAKKNPHAVALGKRGGKVGGPARAASLTPEERSAIALKAAHARWGMKDED